jgi:hypothetical protein
MQITYFNNMLDIQGVPDEDKPKVRELWAQLREDYIDWVADVRMEDFGLGKPLVELLEWKEMSTWWLSPLVRKDVIQGNKWLKRLMVIYLFNTYKGNFSFTTDDKLLIKSIKKNYNYQNITYKNKDFKSLVKNNIYIYNSLRLIRSFISHIKIYILFFEFHPPKEKNILSTASSVFFRSNYPANWITDNNGSQYDRHFSKMFALNKERGQSPNYYFFYQTYGKDKSNGLFQQRENIQELLSRVDGLFVQAYLSFGDYLKVYLNSLLEVINLKLLKRKYSFRKLFCIGGINVSDILIDEWLNNYFGSDQFNKLHGLAFSKCLSEMKNPQTIVNYGEFFVQNRSLYHLCKKISPNSQFVALQHAMNVRNKMDSVQRRSEFDKSNNDNVHFSPKPDYFLTQGSHYSEILNEFFPEDKTSIIGSLKYDNYLSILESKKEYAEKAADVIKSHNKNILLIAPSTNDYKEILNIFSDWKANSRWEVVLCPHPATDVNAIKSYQQNYYPHLKICYETSLRSVELVSAASLVICGFSTIAVEACFFGVRSARFVNLGTFPVFEYEEIIPVFHEAASFTKWFDEQNWDLNKSDKEKQSMDKLVEDYFYKIDGKSADRMWTFLNSCPDLPHNKNIM